MILKITTLLSLISISAYGSDIHQQTPHAVSSHSFHRDDAPLSFHYTAVHDYVPSKSSHKSNHASRPVNYQIQYAPLELKGQSHQSGEQKFEYKPLSAPVRQVENHHEVHNEDIKKDTLEPKLQNPEYSQSYSSFIPGNEVQVLPRPQNKILSHINYAHKNQEPLQHSQVQPPKILFYQQPKQQFVVQQYVKNVEAGPVHNQLPTFGFLPNESAAPQSEAFSLHEHMAFEKQQSHYNHVPKLHLNVAHLHNFANKPQQASLNNQHQPTPVQHPALTQAFFLPKNVEPLKTYLYPIRDQLKDKPIYVPS